MTFDRRDYTDLVESKRKELVNGQRANLEHIHQQAVKGELLTGDEHWDAFLTYIQAAIDQTEASVANYRAMLESPNLVDPNEIMATKIALVSANNRIAAWNAVLQLPKDLKEQGERAEEWLSGLDG